MSQTLKSILRVIVMVIVFSIALRYASHASQMVFMRQQIQNSNIKYLLVTNDPQAYKILPAGATDPVIVVDASLSEAINALPSNTHWALVICNVNEIKEVRLYSESEVKQQLTKQALQQCNDADTYAVFRAISEVGGTNIHLTPAP